MANRKTVVELINASEPIIDLLPDDLAEVTRLDAHYHASVRNADSQVDAVLAVAAVHHFPNLTQALSEINRVMRPGATIVFAMEPNIFWSSVLVALRPFYRRLFNHQANSAADEQAEGFILYSCSQWARARVGG